MESGNQQERLAYLAGIIDGEGWLGLTVLPSGQYRPIIAVHMVGKDWIDHVDEVARASGLPSYRAHLKSSSRWGIYGIKRVQKVLGLVRPYLFIKGAQADLLNEFIDLRLSRPLRSPVSEREAQIRQEIMALNTKGKNPQRLYADQG